MAKKQSANGGDTGGEIVIVFGVALVVFMLWYAFHTKISTIVLGVRMAESWVIGLFTDALVEQRAWMEFVPRSAVTFGQLVEVSSSVGSYIRWLTAPIAFGLGVWLFRRSPTERFRRTYNDRTLPVAVAREYPWMRISITNDFAKMDQTKGTWAIALTERQFARAHGLKNDIGEIDRDKAAIVFVRQLGNVFMGVRSMKPHMRALFALFAARANRDFRTADGLLKQLANSFADGKPDYAGVDQLIEKYKASPIVKKMVARHAYERTLLMSLLEASRGGESGKDYLPPNWFLWVKGVDRALWYALSDVGRRTPHVESAGVFGHWLAEKAIDRRLHVPFVKNAVEGLVIEMAKFINDDEEHAGLPYSEDEARDFAPARVYAPMPSPEEVERAIKSGRLDTLPKLEDLEKPL